MQGCIYQLAVADLGEGLGDPPPTPRPLFWVKKKNRRKEEKQAGKTKKKQAPSLPQGLNPPLICITNYWRVP